MLDYNFIQLEGDFFMKKLAGILTIFAVLTTLIGCDLLNQAQEYIQSTYNQWYKYSGNASINIPLGNDADAEDDGNGIHTLENAEFYCYFDPDAGLTLAVQSEKSEDVEMLGGLISQKVNVTMGGSKLYPNITVTTWPLIKSTVSLQQCDAPKVYSDPEHCFILAGDKAGDFKIQWKKVLTKVLIKQLLGKTPEELLLD